MKITTPQIVETYKSHLPTNYVLGRPLRIVHFNHSMDLGGSETMLLDLAVEQKRLGHSVTICVLGKSGLLDARTTELGLPLIHLNAPRGLWARVRLVSDFLKGKRFDIAHSHWGVWLPVAIAARLSGTCCVHTHHSNQRRSYAAQHRIAVKFTRRVVILTPQVDDYIKRWVGVPRRKLAVIPNGINPNRVLGASRVEVDGIPSDAPVIGMIARLSPPKDYSTFLRAAKIVLQNFPHAHFVAVGGGQMKDALEDERSKMGLANFHFLGHRLDAVSILHRLTINVLSTRNEGLSITLLEASIAGRASIASDIPANRFLFADGKAGLLVPGEDPQALAAAIELLLSDDTLRRSYEERARQRAEDFTSERMARDYLELYAALLNGQEAE